jgi:anti-anti-sigma regulatory factor
VRQAGPVVAATGLGAHDHVCWSHRGSADFLAHALPYLADGVHRGQRISYVGAAPEDELRDRLEQLDGGAYLLVTGAATVVSIGDMYGPDGVVDGDAQVRTWIAHTAAALEAGFTGLRVAAEATELVRTPAQRDAFTRYEHLIDRAMRTLPYTAMCGYDLDELGPDVVAELACVHPLGQDGDTQFRVFARDGVDLAIAGDVDAFVLDAFAQALDRCVPEGSEGLVVDASDLVFIDHRGLQALDRLGRSRGRKIVLERAPSLVGRLAALLELERLEVG